MSTILGLRQRLRKQRTFARRVRRRRFGAQLRGRRGVTFYGRPRFRGRWVGGRDRTGGFYGRYGGGGELKFHDLDIDDATIAGGALIAQASCNLIAQGVTESQRVGRKCVIRSINYRFRFSLPATSTPGDTSDSVRIVIYLDKQANGATAATTQLFENDDYQTFNNLANSSRFVTLMDRSYSLVATAGAYDGTNDQFGEVNINDTFFKRCSIPIEFDATTGAITEIRSNNIGIALFSRAGVAGFSSSMRLRFADS